MLLTKSTQEDLRRISGIATKPTPDWYADIVDPLGATFSMPLPLLVAHYHIKSIGSVVLGAVTKTGIAFKVEIAQIEQPGPLKTLCHDAWAAACASRNGSGLNCR
ncbi:hypothetical protein ABH945_001777 [Paraburkholderia sp. GAS333]|uniref:hypothetical protein n=1 Tax=Paraburkholderia sp. GAS333 TaxID=3156279 RepID=UPI003D22D481